MSFNRIHLMGRLGRDPEMKQTTQGVPVCNFSVATTEKRKDEKVTTWFRVTFWGSLAETAGRYLSKGQPIYIEGSLHPKEWNDREGKAHTSLEVYGTEMKFIDSGSKNGADELSE